MNKEWDRFAQWQLYGIDASVTICADRQPPRLSSELEAMVAASWTAALAARPGLFNGEVFSVDDIAPDRITGHWTEYRRVIARLNRPDCAAELPVKPLAVAGLIEGPDGIVFGRRPAGAVYQPSLWQLAPAGSVDRHADRNGRIDPLVALHNELLEELGVAANETSGAWPLCVVQHPRIDVMDLCIPMTTFLDAASIARAHRNGGNDEYPAIAVVPRSDLPGFLAAHRDSMAPQVPLFLDRYLRQSV